MSKVTVVILSFILCFSNSNMPCHESTITIVDQHRVLGDMAEELSSFTDEISVFLDSEPALQQGYTLYIKPHEASMESCHVTLDKDHKVVRSSRVLKDVGSIKSTLITMFGAEILSSTKKLKDALQIQESWYTTINYLGSAYEKKLQGEQEELIIQDVAEPEFKRRRTK